VRVTCHLCPEGDNVVDDHAVLDHLRVVHPDQYGDGPTRWPDGQHVIVDATLDSGDFQRPTGD
jgi:hypothetical protein